MSYNEILTWKFCFFFFSFLGKFAIYFPHFFSVFKSEIYLSLSSGFFVCLFFLIHVIIKLKTLGILFLRIHISSLSWRQTPMLPCSVFVCRLVGVEMAIYSSAIAWLMLDTYVLLVWNLTVSSYKRHLFI